MPLIQQTAPGAETDAFTHSLSGQVGAVTAGAAIARGVPELDAGFLEFRPYDHLFCHHDGRVELPLGVHCR